MFTEGSNNGPVLIQPQTADDCNWREACVTRRVILRSFEGESDGKSYIHNRREISLIQNHYNYQAAVPNWLPIQGHVTKTRSCRISVPPALWTFYSDFALIYHFFVDFFVVAPHIFWYSHRHKKGVDGCHDLILCITEWPTLSGELVDRATTSSPCTREWEHHRTCVYHTHLYAILH